MKIGKRLCGENIPEALNDGRVLLKFLQYVAAYVIGMETVERYHYDERVFGEIFGLVRPDLKRRRFSRTYYFDVRLYSR